MVAQPAMDFGHRSTNETDTDNLGRALKNCGNPLPRVVSARARSARAIATLGQTADEPFGSFSNEPMREPLTISFSRAEMGRMASLIERLPQLRMLARWNPSRIAIKVKGRILLIDAADVIAVEAKGNYVLLHHTSSSHMLRESIAKIEEKLNPHGFVRIHRSVLVNAALVEEIEPRAAGEYVLRVKGGGEYTVSRTYKKNLQLLAQSWIGTNGFVAE